jgi:ATP-grasp domain, R2K clade family 3
VSADLNVLFCADPLAASKVEPHFAEQAEVVRVLGGAVAVIDHDALMAGDTRTALRRVPGGSRPWWYRGWMIPTPHYTLLANALAERGIELRVCPDQYRTAHELPGWHDMFAELTPESVWMPSRPGAAPTPAVVADLVAPLGAGAAVAKDWVKSRKHEWEDACFIPDLTDLTHATRVIARMVELQEDSLNGGIVVRRFEHYRHSDGRAVEARVWWIDGSPVLAGPHPDTPDQKLQPDLTNIAPAVKRLGCRFVATDIAQREDGAWRVVEVGDGQVSDLPAGVDPRVIFQGL